MTRFLVASLFALVTCEPAYPSDDALTIVSDDGSIALTWDGETARVYHDCALASSFPAATAESAVWRWEEPNGELLPEPTAYHRLLSEAELAEHCIRQ